MTVGRRNGGWSAVHPARLLGAAQRAVLDRTGVDPALIGQVIGGTVTQAGEQSFNLARTAWLAEGLPQQVAASTVDAQCGSSQQAFTLATALVGAGPTDVALACGVESMTRIPIGANFGEQLGLGRPVPKAYQRHYEFLNQFKSAERIAERYGITRDRADAFGLTSQQRAAGAWAQGRFDGHALVTMCCGGGAGDGHPARTALATLHDGVSDDGRAAGAGRSGLIADYHAMEPSTQYRENSWMTTPR